MRSTTRPSARERKDTLSKLHQDAPLGLGLGELEDVGLQMLEFTALKCVQNPLGFI